MPQETRARRGVRRPALACLVVTIAGLGAAMATTLARPARAQSPARTELVGLTLASHLVAVAPEQSGTIVEMPVAEGARIKQGDVLFVLSNRLQELEVLRLRGVVESKLDHERAAASLEHARTKVERMRDLSAQHISARASVQEVELESELARLALSKADFEREQQRIELQVAEERLGQRTLRSPLDGVVTRRLKQLGETTEELAPVMEVMALDPLCVEFECPVADEARFPIGGFVRVRPAIGEQPPRLAEITHVSLRATPASHTFLVRVSMANKDYSWRSGLKVYVDPATVPGAKPPEGK